MTRGVLAAMAAAVAVCLGATGAQASRTVTPTSLDFGTISNGRAGGRAERTVIYSISSDETLRYAYVRGDGGAPDLTTQFSVGGGNCYTAFPPLPMTPASCAIVIQFDYSPIARGLSTGTLLIDGDTNFSTTADELTVPLSANVLAYKKRCKKKHPQAAAAKKCKKRKR
jgi:hypothetical protein